MELLYAACFSANPLKKKVTNILWSEMGTWPQLFVQKSTHSSFLHPLRCGADIVYAVLQDHRPVNRAVRIGSA